MIGAPPGLGDEIAQRRAAASAYLERFLRVDARVPGIHRRHHFRLNWRDRGTDQSWM